MAKQSKDNGTKGELIVAKLFKEMGYWVHITNRNRSGQQPVDIIALKHACKKNEDVCWLVDAKYVQRGERFSFDDIQPDQIESLRYAKEFAKLGNVGFGIIFAEFSESTVYFFPFDMYEHLCEFGRKSIYRVDMSTIEFLEKHVYVWQDD